VVEDAMVTELLTEPLIEAGSALVSKLDEMGLPVQAALWLFDPEVNEWKLRISSKEAREKGSLAIYPKIDEALEAIGPGEKDVPLLGINLIDPKSELIRRLRTGPGIKRIRFKKNVADGTYIEDALIYRAA